MKNRISVLLFVLSAGSFTIQAQNTSEFVGTVDRRVRRGRRGCEGDGDGNGDSSRPIR